MPVWTFSTISGEFFRHAINMLRTSAGGSANAIPAEYSKMQTGSVGNDYGRH